MSIAELAKISGAVQKLFVQKKVKVKGTVLDLGEKSMRTQIFRSDEVLSKVEKNDIKNLIEHFSLESDLETSQLIQTLLKLKIIMRLERQEEDTVGGKLKWPRKMRLCLVQNFDEEKINFFTFSNIRESKSWKAYLIVGLVLLAFLYPIWPFPVRLVAFYMCFYLTIAFFIFQILRLLIYYFFRLFGYEFWILPKINDNNMSIKPLYTFQRCLDERFGIFLRIVFSFMTILAFFYLTRSSQVKEDISYFMRKSHEDALEYGIEKIKFNYTNSSKMRISYETLMEELHQDS